MGVNVGPSYENAIGVNKARADTVNCVCVEASHAVTNALIIAQHQLTQTFIEGQFERHREEFVVDYWFREYVLAAMMMMTEQLVSGAMEQMLIVGSFFDAGQQLETQRLFQRLTAQAHKDYHSSMQMCEIGTLSRSLAASQRRGEYSAYLLSQHLQDRQLRNDTMGSAAGKGHDVTHRWEQFVTVFCNPHGNDGELGDPARVDTPLCQDGDFDTRDGDVDYGLTVDYPNTIPASFDGGGITNGKHEIFALAGNLYGGEVFAYFPEAFFKNVENQDEHMYVRSIVAKRSVAQNSFNAIVGMKVEGTEESAEVQPYMEKVFEQLGIEDAADWAAALTGERPSYYAQMELLTKKLYQRPEFFTGLYDKPVNVDRTRTALQAIGLMQNMDLFKSKLRTEAALAVLTEMEIFKAQEKLQDRMHGVRGTGIQ